jgi:hypothetical protein
MKLFVFIILLALPSFIFAQNTLTVTCTDTVQVPVKAIYYQLTISTELYETSFYENQDIATDARAIDKARSKFMQEKRTELESLLKSNKLAYTTYRTDMYASSPSYRDFSNGFLVTLKSKAEFLRFYEKLGSVDYVSGNIINIEGDPNYDYEGKLTAKLNTKASKQAAKLASATGVKLGKLVGIEDGTANSIYGYAEAYATSIGFVINYTDLTVAYAKSISFKYELQ